MTHRYIRLKSNPNEILASGYVDAGGLGEFDSDRFEEVEGELPLDWTRIDTSGKADRFMVVLDQLSSPDDQLAVLCLRALYEQAILLRLPKLLNTIEAQLEQLNPVATMDEAEVQ